MNEWLLLLLIPLGGAALGQIFQQDDDDGDSRPEPEPESPTEGTDEDDILTAPEGFGGNVTGGDGDDLITVGSPEDARPYHDSTILTDGDGGYPVWPDWDPETRDDVPPGVVVARGGNGDDTVIGSGAGIYAKGDAGDDRIEIDSDPGDIELRDGDHAAVAHGGDGDDHIIASGRGALVRGDAGDDRIDASGSGMAINGGEGADTINVAGLTDSQIVLGRGDVVTGRGGDEDGLRFRLTDGADFTGNATDEELVARHSSRADGAGGDDGLTTYYLDEGSSTLVGGSGNDTLIGADGLASHASSQHDEYSWHIGSSDDVLAGGQGEDRILFDRADTVTGGEGADWMVGFADTGTTSVVSDFTGGEDVLTINLEPAESTAGGNPFGNIEVVERNGDTLIRMQGSDVVRIEGATGLRIGYEISDTIFDQPHYVDRDGNSIAASDLDVILNRYETFYT